LNPLTITLKQKAAMFNKDFFPTPVSLAQKMLEGIDLKGKCVLDPSAGKGNLLEVCRYQGRPAKMYAIEIEPELQSILRGKNDIQVIGDDFLSYSGSIWADLIIMNPPFSAVCKHVRRAWEILRSGDLVAIIPATMIWNPTADESALLEELRAAGATFDSAGAPFKTGERKTDVEVYILRAKKTRDNLYTFGNVKTGTNANGFTFQDQDIGQIVRADMLARLSDTYQAALHGFADVLRATNTLAGILNSLPTSTSRSVFWREVIGEHVKRGTSSVAFNDFAFEIQGRVWDAMFERTHISGMVTSRVKEEFEQLRQKAGGIDLTPDNITSVFAMIMDNRSSMLQDSLEQAFDQMTKHYKDNREVIKGYATNDAWMVKDKLILPSMLSVDPWSMGLHYSRGGFVDDIDKALCLLAGVKYEQVSEGEKDRTLNYTLQGTSETLRDAIHRACQKYRAGYPGKDESYFFNVQVFKVGTVHLWWKDKELLNTFNAKVCQYRNWLPSDYGKSYRR
jgi:hypothetical protein